jgi:transcriptional regulator with XRE-family HTH domain
MPPKRQHPGIPNSVELYRRRAKLSQLQLAERVAISRSRMSQLEGGQVVPSFDEMERIAQTLGTIPGTLFDPRLVELVTES